MIVRNLCFRFFFLIDGITGNFRFSIEIIVLRRRRFLFVGGGSRGGFLNPNFFRTIPL
jgi:hypothetical protein